MLTALTISLAMMVTNPQGSSSVAELPKYSHSNTHHSLGKRPGRWCGWYMRKRLGVSPQKYNLARSWYSWGRTSGPRLGAVVVWPHHVGLIVGRNSKGQWLIESGNDGGKVRTRTWNLRGASFRVA